jgi:hypothetical protein
MTKLYVGVKINIKIHYYKEEHQKMLVKAAFGRGGQFSRIFAFREEVLD